MAQFTSLIDCCELDIFVTNHHPASSIQQMSLEHLLDAVITLLSWSPH